MSEDSRASILSLAVQDLRTYQDLLHAQKVAEEQHHRNACARRVREVMLRAMERVKQAAVRRRMERTALAFFRRRERTAFNTWTSWRSERAASMRLLRHARSEAAAKEPIHEHGARVCSRGACVRSRGAW